MTSRPGATSTCSSAARTPATTLASGVIVS
jgi:hypothetical protein